MKVKELMAALARMDQEAELVFIDDQDYPKPPPMFHVLGACMVMARTGYLEDGVPFITYGTDLSACPVAVISGEKIRSR